MGIQSETKKQRFLIVGQRNASAVEELGIRIPSACAPKQVNRQSGLCTFLSAQHKVRDTLFGPESVIANLIQGH